MTDQPWYAITRNCAIACLAPLLTRPTLDALVAGFAGHNDSPATVGQLIGLYELHGLTGIFNIGTGRAGEIRWALVKAGLIDPGSVPLVRQRTQAGQASGGHSRSCGAQ